MLCPLHRAITKVTTEVFKETRKVIQKLLSKNCTSLPKIIISIIAQQVWILEKYQTRQLNINPIENFFLNYSIHKFRVFERATLLQQFQMQFLKNRYFLPYAILVEHAF